MVSKVFNWCISLEMLLKGYEQNKKISETGCDDLRVHGINVKKKNESKKIRKGRVTLDKGKPGMEKQGRKFVFKRLEKWEVK